MSTEDSVPETVATYMRLRGLPAPRRSWSKRRRRGDEEENAPFSAGRDPLAIGAALDALTKSSGWDGLIARENVVLRWPEIAGPDVAQHSEPVSLEQGMLTVRCDSTAWAKQLQYMRADILTRIAAEHPDAAVENLRFIGPDVPSWKWGVRAVPGRGPRDTYG